MGRYGDMSNKEIYENSIEALESSLVTVDGAKEAIEALRSISDYLDAASKADEYERRLLERIKEEEIRAKNRRAGRAVQFTLIAIGALIVVAVIILTALAVTSHF